VKINHWQLYNFLETVRDKILALLSTLDKIIIYTVL